MPLTTTSGYTFPVSGVPTIQNPDSGLSGQNKDLTQNYGSWNGDWLGYLKYMADKGDSASLDKLLNYMMSETSAQNARSWTAKREDSSYQRLVADMRAAGLNPYAFATLNASPISSSSSGNSYSGSNVASYEINKEKTAQNWLKIALSSALPIIGAAVAALL